MVEHKLDHTWTLIVGEPIECTYSCKRKTRLWILPHRVCLRCWCHPTDHCLRWNLTAGYHRKILGEVAAKIGMTEDIARELA